MEIKWNCFAPRTRRLAKIRHPPISSSSNFEFFQFSSRIISRFEKKTRTTEDKDGFKECPPFPPPPIRICKLGRKADETRNPLTYAWLYTQGTRRNSGDSTVLRRGEAVVFLVEIRVE